ncbi:MAG: ABC transporter permease [Planctomycetota bacterium]
MNPILIIANATAREALRAKSVLLLIALYAVGVLLTPVIGWISATDGRVVNTDLTFSLLSLIGVLVAVATGTALVHTEIQQRTLYTVLSRPIERWHFILGKYIGLCAALILGQAAMLMVALGATELVGVGASWYLVLAGVLIWLEVCIVAAISLCLTSVAGPLLAAALSLAVYALGHAVHELPHFMHHLEGWQNAIAVTFASLIPDLGGLAYRNDAVYGEPPGKEQLIGAVLTTLWIILLVGISSMVMRRKQL